MGKRNVLSKLVTVGNRNNEALAGGKVYLYEPGGNKDDNAIATYSDSALTVENPSPVPLSGSGKASVWINRDADIRVEDRNGQLVFTESNINPDEVDTAAAGGLILNGGFEDDTNADDVPDNWVLVSEAGSNNAIITSESTEGSKSFRFSSTGSGGGNLTTSDFFAVNESNDLKVTFDYRSSVVDVRNRVRVEWYDAAKASISNSDILDESAANPTSFTSYSLSATPPANARFAKLKLIGCDPSNSNVGNTVFDNVRVFYPTTIDGAVGNLQLAGNTLSSTNSNGNINVSPNGTGQTVLFGNGDVTVRVEGNGLLTVLGDTTSDSDQRLLTFKTSAQVLKALIGHNSESTLTIRNDINGAPVQLLAKDAGGTNAFLLFADPDGKVGLFYDAAEVARTITAATGGFEVRNDLTGGGFERVLTVGDQLSKVLTTSDAAITSNTTLADSSLEIADVPVGYYHFEAHVIFTLATTGSQGIKVDFAATGGGVSNTFLNNVIGVRRDGQGTFSSSAEASDGAPGTDQSVTLSGAGNGALSFSGVVQITTAGDWTCRVAQAVSSANSTTLAAGSFMRLTRLTE